MARTLSDAHPSAAFDGLPQDEAFPVSLQNAGAMCPGQQGNANGRGWHGPNAIVS